jgi:competence protein ComEA
LVTAGFGVVAVVGLVVWVALSLLRPAQAAPPEVALPRASTTVASSVPSTTAAGVLVVQASGAVAAPGLYRLPAGARVDDLVRAAGGFSADADPDRVNLAAPLEDGTRIYIPHRGEVQVPEPVVGASPPSSGGGGTQSSGAPVNLNRATEADLEALPGIGPALAQAIIDYRTAHGAFASVDQLLEVRGIGDAKLEQLRTLVIV